MPFSETDGLKLIGSARHALLNELQLIKGYLFLKRTEKANELMDQLTDRLRVQAQLSHLQIPECAFYLITYSWAAHSFQFSIGIDGGEANLSANDHRLSLFFEHFFDILEKFAADSKTNKATVTFHLNATELSVTEQFEGILTDAAQARERMAASYRTFPCVEHYEADDSVPNKVRWQYCLSI